MGLFDNFKDKINEMKADKENSKFIVDEKDKDKTKMSENKFTKEEMEQKTLPKKVFKEIDLDLKKIEKVKNKEQSKIKKINSKEEMSRLSQDIAKQNQERNELNKKAKEHQGKSQGQGR